MKIAKWTLVILVMLVIFSIAAMACSAKQPAINRDVEYSGKGAPPEEIRYEFITYIPLQDPKDIGDLLQKVDRWIKNYWQE